MMQFIGHLHPVIVHMPIGILLLGVFLMLFQGQNATKFDSVISLALLLGSIGATVACITGWLLAQSGAYDELILQKHQWIGIATACIGWSVYFLKKYKKILATLLFVFLIFTGHFGSTLTHGENYLIGSDKNNTTTQAKKEKAPVTNTIQTVVNGKDSIKIIRHNFYKEEIKPLLEIRCYNCHGSLKQKGRLRLDSESFIKKGGKDGIALLAGNPLKSKMYANLILPLEDDKHMPPKGKHQLTAQEINTIKKWILNGASFDDQIDTIKNIQPDLKTATVGVASPKKENKLSLPTTSVSNMPRPVKNETLEYFKNKNILLTNMGESSNWIMANFVNAVPFNIKDIVDLKMIEPQLTVLKLSNLPIKDNDIQVIAGFKNITRLNLENTAITDQSMAYLQQLPKLEQLNLYGTNITDESLQQLALFKNLSVLYLWKTKVTKAGVANFVKIKTHVKIDMGDFKFQQK